RPVARTPLLPAALGDRPAGALHGAVDDLRPGDRGPGDHRAVGRRVRLELALTIAAHPFATDQMLSTDLRHRHVESTSTMMSSPVSRSRRSMMSGGENLSTLP